MLNVFLSNRQVVKKVNVRKKHIITPESVLVGALLYSLLIVRVNNIN